MKSLRTGISALAFLGLTCTGASAQVGEGRLSIGVAIPKSDLVRPSEDTRRLYAESDELRVEVSLVNESDLDVAINQETLRRALGVSVAFGTEAIPVVATWSEDGLLLRSESDTRVLVSRTERLVVEGHGGVYWPVALRRSDGLRFGSGLYRLAWGTRNLAAAVSRADGSSWNGRAYDELSSVGVLIRPPQNGNEESRMHNVEADAAVKQDDIPAAVAAYQRALKADPADGRTKTMLAFMHLRMDRYRDAIPLLEELLFGAVGEQNLSSVLALAYVGAGDEGNAARVLRITAGLTNQGVSAELETIRREVAQRRGAPRR